MMPDERLYMPRPAVEWRILLDIYGVDLCLARQEFKWFISSHFPGGPHGFVNTDDSYRLVRQLLCIVVRTAVSLTFCQATPNRF
ncbi:hypothetical protein Poly59_26540 [Rubripirellula reticaptiva]|uniref:Uncharacterized protein n=1 Tax=Rubripirellula reticaptiva TaxID=2528013 RepID=A0A5C6F6Z2_9BACT|nr:hypothetical protein Poly59_26540 [Rubripirellula reticaptiva]